MSLARFDKMMENAQKREVIQLVILNVGALNPFLLYGMLLEIVNPL
ncbi:MAG: hypothetical protein R6U35_07575 [Candidatus Humimicrobiaceae bacterium]